MGVPDEANTFPDGPINCLLDRNKFPVRCGWERPRKPLDCLLNYTLKTSRGGPGEQNSLYFPS